MKSLLSMLFLFYGVIVNAQEVRSVKITELEKIIAESKTPLVVNMWATWCKPCIEELPYFMSEVKAHSQDSVQLLLVSLDFKEAFPAGIASFLKKRKYETSVVWLDETDADYFCPKFDPKWSGSIPASLFINNKTGYRHFVEEQLTHEELKKNIAAMISGL